MVKELLVASVLSATCLFCSHSFALSTINFASGVWDLPSSSGDFYRQEGFTVQAPNGAVDPSSVGLQQWEWTNFCSSACGATIVNPTTVSFMDGTEFFDLISVTVVSNLGGMRFNADGGLQATFAPNDVGLKLLDWRSISVLTVTNLLPPDTFSRRDAAIDSIRVSEVPEPTAAILFGFGLLGLAVRRQVSGLCYRGRSA